MRFRIRVPELLVDGLAVLSVILPFLRRGNSDECVDYLRSPESEEF
jgi:hypothetical protein